MLEVNHAVIADDGEMRWEVMAKRYYEKLAEWIAELNLGDEVSTELVVKQLFNGAALYADGKICVSWSPVGLAFRLDDSEVAELIAGGQAKPLKYFAKGRIKKGYALFNLPDSGRTTEWKPYFIRALSRQSYGK